MGRAGIVGLMFLAAMAGCNAVAKKDYDALQVQYNELDVLNSQLKGQLDDLTMRETELQAQVLAERQGRTRAEDAAAKIGGELAKDRGGPGAKGWSGVGERAATEFTLGSELFGGGKAKLTSAGQARIKQVSASIRSKYPDAAVLVYGHTDSDPIRKSSWKDNLELSCQRAMAVTRALIANGLPAKKIETIGMGSEHPVAANTSAANKAKNRRVVIKVLQ
ncbi:MAG: OmpA family protein [Planctomycetes bacterium]|nr:OmpA family protein [Planctomycetota bacterium]